MDRIDKKIIAELQKNGRISLTELCEKVGISLSPCQRRVKQLEQDGVILDYQANISPQAVGLNFSAIVFAVLKDCSQDSITAFENALADIPEIIQAQRLFGEHDYILHIVTTELGAFQKLYDQRLSNLPSIHRLTSTLVMKEILQRRALPI